MAAPDPFEPDTRRFLDAWLKARQIIQAANFNRFQNAGLSATQFMTLNLIPPEGQGLTLSELARRMNLSLQTLTKTVNSLETRGMLLRTRSRSDRRLVHITLTDAGKLLQNQSSREFHNSMAQIFRAMDPPMRSALIDGLENLVATSVRLSVDAATPARRNSGQSPPP